MTLFGRILSKMLVCVLVLIKAVPPVPSKVGTFLHVSKCQVLNVDPAL
jgi:hypothetical protein